MFFSDHIGIVLKAFVLYHNCSSLPTGRNKRDTLYVAQKAVFIQSNRFPRKLIIFFQFGRHVKYMLTPCVIFVRNTAVIIVKVRTYFLLYEYICTYIDSVSS